MPVGTDGDNYDEYRTGNFAAVGRTGMQANETILEEDLDEESHAQESASGTLDETMLFLM